MFQTVFFTKKVIENIYNVHNVKVVYPGIEPQLYSQCGTETTRPSESRLIVAVGSLTPVKNHYRLIQALKEIEAMNIDFKCYIIGQGPERDRLLELTRSSKNISILSDVDDMELCKIYAKARFIAHTALAEPFGLVPLEAARFGRPSIVSSTGGTVEFVINGVNGLVVEPRRVDEITNAIKTLLEDDDLVDKMGHNAKLRLYNGFTAKESTINLIKIIRETTHSDPEHPR